MNAFKPLICNACKPSYHDAGEPSLEGCDPIPAGFWMCDACHNEFYDEDEAQDCCAKPKETRSLEIYRRWPLASNEMEES